MKILVTGGAGFIGSHIVDALVEQGHEVHIMDDLSTGQTENLNPRATFHQMDVASPEAARLIVEGEFDLINHHAAQLDVRKSVADPVFDAQVNVLGTVNLLEAAAQSGVKKVIFASSGGTVYGEQSQFPATEEHPIAPISPYGIAKATGEMYLHFYHQQYGIPYVALRYANVYGPRQNPHGEAGVVAIFANKMLEDSQPTIHGDGEQTRDYVFVGDVVQANLKAMEYEGAGAFNVGTGRESSVNELFDAINTQLGGRFERQHGPGKPGEQRRSVLDASKLEQETGWQPQYDLALGMADTVAWFKKKHGVK